MLPPPHLVATAVALTLLVGTARTEPASPATAARPCPGTLPNHVVPSGEGFDRARFNYGSSRLRAHLNWSNGTLRAGALPGGGVMATIEPDGSIRIKQGWWRRSTGRLVITGRRLDAPAPPLVAHVPSGYGDSGFIGTALVFPTPGCWRVTGRQGAARLSYVVRIVKLQR